MSAEGPRVVVGTAGHIDHGKTALLRALTGIDADRLPEERARGMTLDVGYAHLRLDDGDEIDFVDVPGHDRLIGNMLVGAGEIDAALLVVAADDGPRAQTIEHLELLDALSVADGIVAMTKIDLLDDADDPRGVLVPEEIAERLARTSLAGSPIVPVSSVSGEGLVELCAALAALRDRVRARPGFAAGGGARLAIDRAFGVRGRGVVVTGSLRGGTVGTGDMLRLDPGGVRVRVREVQVHGHAVDRASRGGRVALNLAGVALGEVRRGLVLSDGDGIAATDRLLVALRRVGAPAPGEPLRLHVGTDQADAVVSRGRRETTTLADGRTTALLRLARPVAVGAGDRFVLRRPSPPATVAGGVVLDPLPPFGVARRRIDPPRLATLVTAVELGSGLEAGRLELHGALEASGRVALAGDVGAAVAAAIDAELRAHDATIALADARSLAAREIRRRATLSPESAARAASAAIEDVIAAGSIRRDGDLLSLLGAAPAADRLAPAMDRLEAALAVAMPPPLREAAAAAACPPAGIRRLEAAGRIVRLEDDLAYAASTFREIERLAVSLATAEPLTPARLRDATGSSRRFVMAIIEELDRSGVLRRTAAGHIRGPAAGTPA